MANMFEILREISARDGNTMLQTSLFLCCKFLQVAWCLGNERNVEATKDWAANVS